MNNMKHEIWSWLKLSALTLPLSVLTACRQDDIVPDVPDTPAGEYLKVRFTTADGNTSKPP